MSYPLASARKRCNDSEFAPVSASFGGNGIAWTPALLRAKIERTLKLRDKSLDKSRQIDGGQRLRVRDRYVRGPRRKIAVQWFAGKIVPKR